MRRRSNMRKEDEARLWKTVQGDMAPLISRLEEALETKRN